MKLGLKRDEVMLVPYTDEWEKEFQRVKKEIQENVNLDETRIEHIGSTSIVNMDAKPILDIVVGLDDITNFDNTIIIGLQKVGFLRLKVERPNEIVFAKFVDDTYEEKTHYIHLVDFGNELWNNLIFFRDYLNSNESAREEYKNLKADFIRNKQGGIKEYTDNKEKFVNEIYGKRKNV
ncbi:GrpB family protein [Paucisalibacillus globulus]|uniref:GrpB family protein n=1 Tax=Paucisalibacillus globulus TaxID=351095 RepID=UPI00047B9E76|nr:GrpB family protein [Paucisalibacillus globulus]